jgi:hypothetical protein
LASREGRFELIIGSGRLDQEFLIQRARRRLQLVDGRR